VALSDLDFSLGLSLQAHIHAQLGTSITPSPSVVGFLLVASFGRSAIHLNEDSVALMLESCLGSQATLFRVHHVSGWSFQFQVRSKAVGFWLYDLKSVCCKIFSVHFSLWVNGGPTGNVSIIFGLRNSCVNGLLSFANVAKHPLSRMGILRIWLGRNLFSSV
jgi:hypothetical protein